VQSTRSDALPDASTTRRFEQAVLVHLDAAYNLARWITRDPAAAEDAVQEACVRALRFFEAQHGVSVKAWFMAIVRNVCLDWIEGERRAKDHESYDEYAQGPSAASLPTSESPESMIARSSEARWLHACIATLPREYREVIVLRELEELSYKEIGAIVDVPVGTVMSRLARGRALLQERLVESRRRSHS
jgi:RNA polymerase sigma-70 factor, ECF subfamily